MSVKINGRFLNQPITGVQRYAREIISEFEKLNYAYQLLIPNSFLSDQRSLSHLWEQWILPYHLKSKEVLWSPCNIGPLHVPDQVITLHDTAAIQHPEWFSKKFAWWYRQLIPKLVKNCSGIITVSKFSKEFIIECLNVPPEKVEVIYSGINAHQFYVAEETSIDVVKKQFSLKKNYVLTLGTLTPRKNVSGVLKAWYSFNDSNTDLVIVGGEGNNFSTIPELNSLQEDNVKLIGYVEDKYLAPLYSGAQAFIYPSFFEGFGLPILEAMSCGTPVITSNIGALKEVSGEAAYLVNPYNPSEMAKAIKDVIHSNTLAKELRELGLKRTHSFTWKKAAEQTYTYISKFT